MAKKPPKPQKGQPSSSGDGVGYGRPPIQHRFGPGKSGNSRGRPKGRRNVANVTQELVNKPVKVRTGDQTVEMRAVEAIFRVLTNKAAQGNTKAAALVDKLRDMAGLGSTATDEQREQRGLRMQRAPEPDEFNLRHAEALEKKRQRYLAMAEALGDDGPEIVPTAVKMGDHLAANGNNEGALAAYRSQLTVCKTELTADVNDKSAQYQFRRVVARMGLVADTVLWAGDFERAIEITDEVVKEASTGFWIKPELSADHFLPSPVNIVWVKLIRAHALMFRGNNGDIDQARVFYRSFQTEPKWVLTPWEGTILRDFVQFRRLGYSDPLMAEIECYFADVGHVRDTELDIPSPIEGDLEYSADIRRCDGLAKQNRSEDALTGYRRILTDCQEQLTSDPSDRSLRATVYVVIGRIGYLAKQLLFEGRDELALSCAREAIAHDPYSTLFNLNHAHALMFLEQREESRAIYFSYHGCRVSPRAICDDLLREEFALLTKNGRLHSLMTEVQRRFNNVIWRQRLDASGEVKGSRSATAERQAEIAGGGEQVRKYKLPVADFPRAAVADAIPLTERGDVHAGDSLLRAGHLEAALEVYKRCLQLYDAIIRAKRMPKLQETADRSSAFISITEIALLHLADGEYEKARATIDFALSVEPNSPIAQIRRAHVLIFDENDNEEARSVYLRYRGQKVTADLTAESFIVQDVQVLRAAGRTAPRMDEIEGLLRTPDIPHRSLVR